MTHLYFQPIQANTAPFLIRERGCIFLSAVSKKRWRSNYMACRCPPSSCEELTKIALALRERVDLDPQQRFRLVGVGLSNFQEPELSPVQPELFE